MKFNLDKLKILFSMGFMFILCGWMTAQTTVSGKILDTDDLPLIGASVLVEGTSDGTTADLDGSFSLRTNTVAPFNLVISYTGYASQTIAITGNSSDLSITMEEEATNLADVVISASRKREKVQEAPASVSVLTARKLENSANATDPTRNLVNLAGVQIQQQSANRINISMRGGASLFGTGVFPIMDYRSLVGPGIGTFQSDQAGLSNLDMDRIEVVRGPGSALYGPGVTQGVVHFLTKSPIDKPGTSAELMFGELNTFGVGVRHGSKISDKFGFKVNAHYRKGDEFTLNPNDPDDALQIAKFQNQIVQPAVKDGIVDPLGTPEVLIEDLDDDGDGNPMQADWFNTSFNATLEFRPSDNLSVVTSGGYNQASSVFYNEQGEGQAQASEYWAQARVQAGGLFGQVFYVDNDGGSKDNPTFLYQTGNRTPVARTQLEAQLQYNFQTPSILDADWTAGFDYRFAGQETENLVYGRNEDDDDYSVIGGYIQGKFALAKKLDLVLAGRYDRFNFIDDGAFAPRAALVYKVNPKHTFRAAFNRSNSTVSNLQLNIDFPLSVLSPNFDIWLYGNKNTQTFNNAQTGWLLTPAINGLDQMPLGVPYGAVNDLVVAGISDALDGNPLQPLVLALLAGVDANQLGFFSGELGPGFNIFDGTPLGLIDAPISEIATTDNFEIGYKGLLGDKLGVMVDLYYVKQKNFSQFTAISPAYKLQNTDQIGGELGAAVAGQIMQPFIDALEAQGQPVEVAQGIWAQFSPLLIGAYAAGGAAFAANIDGLPFHAITPTDQVPNNGFTHLSAGYRTFDERDFFGADIGLEYYFNENLTAFVNYSTVSDVEFMQLVKGNEGAGPLPSYLNIPKNKYRLGLNYTPEMGLRASVAFQHDDSYFANAGQFSGDTDERNLIDASIGYKFDFGLAVDLSATNLMNNEYRYLPNMPKIGRRGILKLRYDFGYDN